MDRILDVFRIIELLKRNTNTRGLQGKELRKFLTLVDGFKRAVVEDIVLVKKDTAEVRMRRAGYLRYIHRTSYDILEDRYSDKNWKTGEKITPGASSSSSFEMIVEELDPLPRYVSPSLFAQAVFNPFTGQTATSLFAVRN